MALVIKDRVKETTTTTGTATYQLAGAVSGSEGFIQVGDGNTTYYVCTDNTSFEIGIGTFTDASPDTLARTSILQAKDVPNGTTDQAVDWSSGTRTIFCTYPADKAVFEDASNNINGTFVGGITGDVTGNADTATALANARTIGGVSFNGTGNIDLPGVNASGNQDTSGNATTATTLANAREINGTSFNGSANITVTAAAGTLTGNTLNSTVTASSLTSLGTLASDLNVGGQDVINAGVSSADTHAGIYGSSSSPVEFTVTVASKTASHPYYGDGSSSAYFINGVESPALTLHGVDNVTSNSEYYYRFTLSSSDMSSHPFRLYLDADKTTAYTTGVTTTSTYLQIAVNEDTPNILYYQCSSHAYMGNHAIVLGSNKINHSEALISFPTATTTLVGTGTTDTLTNKTLDVDSNTVSNIEVDNFKASAIVLESEGIGSNDNDTSLPTSAAVKDYVDTQITAEDLDISTDSGTIAIDLDSETLSVAGGEGINTSATGNEITIAGEDATTSNKGVAKFNTADFAVSSGDVTIKASGVSNTQLAGSIANSKLANSSVTVSDGSNTSAVALGGTLTFSGTSNEVEVAESSGTVTIGLPSAITANVTGALTGNADTASALATGRTIGMTGDVVWTSASFTGAGNVTGTATIQAGAVENSMLADDAVGADELAANAVVNASVASGAAIDATKIHDGSISNTEFGHLNNVSSNIQTQIDAKASKGFATAMAIAL